MFQVSRLYSFYLDNYTILYGNHAAGASCRFRRMRYHDDRLAGRLIDLPKQAHSLRSGLATYVFVRLICEKNLRITNQGAGNGHTLLAAGQYAGRMPAML